MQQLDRSVFFSNLFNLIVPSAVATTGGATMALPKMDFPAGKDRKGPVPDMDSIHRLVGFCCQLFSKE